MLQSVILTYYKQVIIAKIHMRSCMTAFDKAINTKLCKLALLTDNQKPKRIALLMDDISKTLALLTSIITNG